MKNRLYKLFIVGFLLIGQVFLNSCEKEKVFPFGYENTQEEFYTIMDSYYLWKDSIASFDYNNYSSPQDLLEAMRYTPRDKWSYITTKQEDEQHYVEGVYVGYGFGYTSDSDGNIRITYIYADSDFNNIGIKRGWIIKKINGTYLNEDSDLSSLLGENIAGVSNSFEFESPTGELLTQTFEKKEVKINTVVYKNVFDVGTHKVGYLVFESFIGPSEAELADVFDYFKTENIDELVIDLRYNGGGMISIVEYLAGLIIPDALNGKKFLSYIHNAEKTSENQSIYFEQDPNSVRLNKVYFIASKGSASASEAIINGLDPYMDVYIVGDDTYGKPVGMYSFKSRISDLVYVPISFSLVNADNYGGYFDGLKADSYVEDDVRHDFGLNEATFEEVLHHIESGSFTSLKSSHDIYRAPVKEIRSLRDELGSL